MTCIRLRFPASRYHANPWGRHVNEGIAEWPPSPYRLLRALYDTWRRKCPDVPEERVSSALALLGAREPRFGLPAAVASHTRSYLSSNGEDPSDKSLIFDAFVALNRGCAPCFIVWPDLTLSPEERETLGQLLQNLNYLGRSESWVEADLFDGTPKPDYWCDPLSDPVRGGAPVPVACVVPPEKYAAKQPWFDALTVSTTDMLKRKESAPPLLRTVRYVRPERALVTHPVIHRVRVEPSERAVLLSLSCTVLPLATATIEVAEQIRVRLMGAHRKRMDNDPSRVSPLFSGKIGGKKRLDHGHIFILPLSNDRGRIDRILLLSKSRAFTRQELDAIGGVDHLRFSYEQPVRCVISWQGSLDDPVIRSNATCAVSATPFVTVRHMRKGRELEKFLTDEVRRECRNLGIPEPSAIEMLPRPARSLFESVEFRRNRRDDPPRPGWAFRLTFSEPVMMPFSLGYGCHFGLGQFVAKG
ncbi:MAG TPA: type I-U CRISPR-associated protein Csb2 [Bryobacteraceae bacterium]|nr:type I-U CRISPR-associated protein Csb2 [Bryobacteraceae bacterium]